MSSPRATIKEIADALGRDRTVALRRARREGWPRTMGKSRGGRQALYDVAALPDDVRAALERRRLSSAAEPSPTERRDAAAPAPRPADAAAWQIACRDARLALLAEVDAIRLRTGLSARRACLTLVELARGGQLRADLAARIPVANARAGRDGKRSLSLRTVQGWLAARDQGGAAALLPRPATAATRQASEAWRPYLLRAWAQPQNPSLADVLRVHLPRILPEGVAPPSYDQARRFLKSLPAQERERGRKGPRAMFALKQYTKRLTEDLEPTAVYTADGTVFRAEVENPLSGQPFKPEVTPVLDVATRKCVGWSASLSESASGVTDALRSACLNGGVPAIWYTDNGPGFDNIQMDAPLTGLLARLGTVNYDSLPDRSHSRGIIERFQQVFNRAAKELPTYGGRDADGEFTQAVFKRTRREIRETGASRLIMPWEAFLAFCQQVVDRYNDTPHRGLARITDPVTGRRRHQTPNEAWAAWEARGWRPVTVAADEADDLFRSYELRKSRRALVTLFGNEYFHPALEPYHDREVAVGYDIHDARRVWVREVERGADTHRLGRLICVADWNAHATRYVPVSMEERGKENRVKQALRRLDDKRGRALSELDGPRLVEHEPGEPAPLTIEERERAEALIARIERRDEVEAAGVAAVEDMGVGDDRPAGARPTFASDIEWARWVLQHPDRATPEDGRYLREKLRRRPFRDLLEMEGLSAQALRDVTEQLRGVA